MNRRLFLKIAGLTVGMGLVQPVELIKLFKPKSTTFYSLPSIKTFTTEELSNMLKKTYGNAFVPMFERTFLTYERFRVSTL